MGRALRVAVLALGCASCAAPPQQPLEPQRVLEPAEAWGRLTAAEAAADAGDTEEALAALADLLSERIPDDVRREAHAARVRLDRKRFLQRHPLVLGLEIEGGEALGDPWTVRARITHLGAEPLRIALEDGGGFFRWMGRRTARAVLRLRCAVRDAGPVGTAYERSWARDVVLGRDVSLEPGASLEFLADFSFPTAPGTAWRTIRASARLIPSTLLDSDGSTRAFSIDFAPASQVRCRPLPGGGRRDAFDWLVESLGGDEGDPTVLFTAAASLSPGRLVEGLGLLASAAPSLDPERSRAALSALEAWTAQSFGGDPTRAAAWWEAVGSRLPARRWLEVTGLDAGNPSVRVLAGGGP